MMPLICPGCGGRMDVEPQRELVPFSCPYCAKTLLPEANGQAIVLKAGEAPAPAAPRQGDARGAEALLQQAAKEEEPLRRHRLLLEAEALAPEDLQVQKALLLHGRLHERDKRKVDFSVIKCYLLHMFEEPGAHPSPQREAMLRELFQEERLLRAKALAPDPPRFLQEYFTALCTEYIRLFLKGSNRHMRPIFGFSLGGKPERLLAAPAAGMLMNMNQESLLSPQERDALARAFYAAFARELGETSFLREALGPLAARFKD